MGWKRIVATVMGLVLLVGGIGAGLVLVRQPQIFQPKAACSCYPSDEGHCKGEWFNVDGCTCMGTKNCPDENTPKPKDTPAPNCKSTDKCCPPDEKCQENANGKNTGYNCTCVAVAGNTYDWRCTDYNTDKCDNGGGPPPAGSFKCDDGVTKVKVSGNCLSVVSGGPVSMTRYSCPEGTNMSNGCSENPESSTTTELCADAPSSNWCGTVQIDYGQHPSGCSVSRKFPCSSSSPTTKPGSTSTPPLCEAVKAYTDTTWVELSTAELKALKPGAKIHFAVGFTNGNSGTIDKAKFTINGVEGSEVTTKHGSLFYVDFTVPTGTLNFSVSAKLHSTVFNWF